MARAGAQTALAAGVAERQTSSAAGEELAKFPGQAERPEQIEDERQKVREWKQRPVPGSGAGKAPGQVQAVMVP